MIPTGIASVLDASGRGRKHAGAALGTAVLVLVGVLLCQFGWAGDDRGLAGTVEAPAQTPAAGTATAQKWALIIGVGTYYDNPALSTLSNAVQDAKALRKALVNAPGGFPEKNVLLMTDDSSNLAHRPTRGTILAHLDTWVSQAKPGDSFLVFFAGHGVDDGGSLYLMPRDGFMASVEETGIAYSEITRKLKDLRVNCSVVILDACHSGAGRGIGVMATSTAADIERHSQVHITFASSKENEISHEYKEKGHGAFTWYLLEALRGRADTNGDEVVSVNEVISFTTEHVQRWAKANRLEQTPTRWGTISGEFPLVNVAPRGYEVAKLRPPEPAPFSYMIGIPAGTFQMGSSKEEIEHAMELARRYGSPKTKRKWFKDEQPQRPVAVGAFFLSRYEVTNKQYKDFVDATGYRTPTNSAPGLDSPGIDFWRGNDYPRGRADDPVVNVSYEDAVAYCEWLCKRTGKQYRLPTEAEWEYAAKSGKNRVFPWGDEWRQGACNSGLYLWDADFFDADDSDGFLLTAPVHFFRPNEFGLHQMSGNVAEWCAKPLGRPSKYGDCVVRGGWWSSTPLGLRCANRFPCKAETRSTKIGFRVAHD